MMKQFFIVLNLSFSFDNHHLKHWEYMDSKLKTVVDFQIGFISCWNARICDVCILTGSFASNPVREPRLLTEQIVGDSRRHQIKNWIITQFQHRFQLNSPWLTLVSFWEYFLINIVFGKGIIAILGNLSNKAFTNMKRKLTRI
jgi:hypothetical protein